MDDDNDNGLHIFYIVMFTLLIMSYIWHMCLYENTCLPDNENPPKKRNYSTYMNNMYSSMIRAFVFGVITSNASYKTGIENAVIYGMVSPILLYIGH